MLLIIVDRFSTFGKMPISHYGIRIMRFCAWIGYRPYGKLPGFYDRYAGEAGL